MTTADGLEAAEIVDGLEAVETTHANLLVAADAKILEASYSVFDVETVDGEVYMKREHNGEIGTGDSGDMSG